MTRRKLMALGSVAGVAGVGAAAFSKRYAVPQPLSKRPQQLVSAGGMLQIELAAAEQWVDLASKQARLYAFNGRVPGPKIELRAGDEVRVRFINNLPEPSNLHYHGVHLPPDGQADNVFLQVPPGEIFDYSFQVPVNHPAGFFWVHPHLHGLVAKQVSRGLASPLVIRGDLDNIPEVAAASEHFMILQDFELDADGRLVEPGMSAMMMGREGSMITVSGRLNPTYQIEQDGMLRLRLLNASTSRFYRLKLEDHPMHVIATDGGAIPSPETVEELVLAPGERRDVLIQGTRQSGSYGLMNLPYDRGMAGGMMGGMGEPGDRKPVELATFHYEDRAQHFMGLPQKLIDVPALPASTGSRIFELSESMGMMRGNGMGMRFLINSREFDHERIDTNVRLGSVEEWEYVNTTTMDHPMHIHTNSFQLIGPDGQPDRAWRDIIVVKARSRARMRIKFEEFAGKTAQHCHILDHEDRGMMSTILMER